MATFIELHEQAQNFLRQAEQQRLIEAAAALDTIAKTMNKLNISLDELMSYLLATGFHMNRAESLTATRTRIKRQEVDARYINTATGETWSGRGRPPRWIVESEALGVSRDSYLRHR